jgi:mono/diheme cytochrome c family protein
MLKPYLLLTAVVLFGFTSISVPARPPQEAAPAPSPAPGAKNPVKPTAESQAKAKKLYQIDCALCHGDNGDGKTDVATSMELTLSDWTDPKSLASRSDQELFDAIRKGKGKMPAEAEGRATNNEVWNLILYIRGMAKSQPAAAPATTPAPAAAPAPVTTPAPGN